MSVLYADTSALVRAYLADEPDHAALREQLLDGHDLVVTCEIARVEVAGAVMAAAGSGRLANPNMVLDRFDADCSKSGPLILLDLRIEPILRIARKLVLDHRIRTLDALHLAVASADAVDLAAGDAVVLVTRDRAQSAAARALGMAVA